MHSHKSPRSTGWNRVSEIRYLLFLIAQYHRQRVQEVAESEEFKNLYARAQAAQGKFAHEKPPLEPRPHELRTLELKSELFQLQLQLGRNLIESCRNERWKTIRHRLHYHIRRKNPK
jgi:hypothetical protein